MRMAAAQSVAESRISNAFIFYFQRKR
jgi:hypothetical protein